MASIMKFTGLVLKNLFSKPVTKNYPAEERKFPERSRGSVQVDIDQCIFCGSCQRKCPSSAITVDRAARTWSIDRMGCVQCENCVNNCPKKCLHMDVHYTEPEFTKVTDTVQGPPPAPKPEKPELTPEKIAELKAAAAAKKAAKAAAEAKND